MNINDLCTLPMNPAKAYVLGMIYALTKKITYNNNDVLLGSVNHNSTMIDADDLVGHFQEVTQLLTAYGETVEIRDNSELPGLSKKGFSLIVNESVNSTILLRDTVETLKSGSEENKKSFLKGCFDGRSSYDTTSKYLSIDCDSA